jgi:hypothetical protein
VNVRGKETESSRCVFSAVGWYGILMGFSRLPISSAVHVACAVPVLACVNIAVFIVCEV